MWISAATLPPPAPQSISTSNGVSRTDRNPESTAQVRTEMQLAREYQTAGHHCAAVEVLERSLRSMTNHTRDPKLELQVQAALGGAYVLTGRFEEAKPVLEKSLLTARASGDRTTEASVLQSLGTVELMSERPLRAPAQLASREPELVEDDLPPTDASVQKGLRLYREAMVTAEASEDSDLQVRILLNLASLTLLSGEFADAQSAAERAREILSRRAPSADTGFLQTSCGYVFLLLAETPTGAMNGAERVAQQLFDAALASAAESDWRTRTYGLGYLGELRSWRKDWPSALALTLQALEVAQRANLDEARFRWIWQAARILRAQGDTERALVVYQQAIDVLRPLRGDFFASVMHGPGRSSFRQSVGQIYYERADLLLESAGRAGSPEATRALLIEARRSVESLRVNDLEEFYFDTECAGLIRSRQHSLDDLPAGTAVLYYIPLADRTEILVTLNSGLRRYRSNVKLEDLELRVRQFRDELQGAGTFDPMGSAHQLWKWLVEPVDGLLREEKITTVVFIGIGALTTIPPAALYDGRKYLVEDFALAISPGLSLMESRPVARSRLRPLLAGLSKSFAGSPPLPAVPEELSRIQAITQSRPPLLDDAFQSEAFAQELDRHTYSVVHIASHGYFGANARETFLQTADGRLTMSRLEELMLPHMLSRQPVELLVLSACETAAGNERAALGLAGVAIKAGARSALASLWRINDEAAREVMTAFYQNWVEKPKRSRAEALQAAQRAMIGRRDFGQPEFWAPFVLIGRWD